MAKVAPVKHRQNFVPFEYDEDLAVTVNQDRSAHRREDVLRASSTFKILNGSAPEKTTPQPAKTHYASHSQQVLEIGKVGGTDRRTADKLKKGRMEIDARLDLHGRTLEQAHSRLYGFVMSAHASGARCVLVVTGKGRSSSGEIGKLKAAVPRWLNEPVFRPYVLSLSYAQQRDGGDGALYVLLRKKGNLR